MCAPTDEPNQAARGSGHFLDAFEVAVEHVGESFDEMCDRLGAGETITITGVYNPGG